MLATKPVPRFEGFGPHAIDWFIGLDADNSKAYFDRTRSEWERDVRQPLLALLDGLSREFGGRVKLFRQYRDVRFSADKSPIKPATYAVLSERPGSDAALYAQMTKAGLYAGTGYYQMGRDQLERYRAAVDAGDSGPALEAAVADATSAGLLVEGDGLATVPRGFRKDHPRASLLGRKSLIAGVRLTPAETLSGEGVLQRVAATWRTAAPITDWLDAHVGRSTLPPTGR